MRRFLKKHLNRYLPDRVRQSVKQHFAAKFGGVMEANLVFEETASALRCTIDDVWWFHAPLDCKDNDVVNAGVVQMRIESIPDAASRWDIIPQSIKLDIESYEDEAIKGSLEFLARHKPVLFLELHLNYLDQRNISARTVVQMVEECGYRFYASSGLPLQASELYDSPLPNVHVIAR